MIASLVQQVSELTQKVLYLNKDKDGDKDKDERIDGVNAKKKWI